MPPTFQPLDKSKKLIVILGPTASGKTALAVRLAQQYNAEVFSADSRQIYRELNIGVARPSEAEMQGIMHHFINCVSITEDYHVGRYEQEVLTALHSYFDYHDTAILAGGTGLYLKAVTHGIDPFPDTDPYVLQQLQHDLDTLGLPALAEELRTSDPLTHASIDHNNARRVVRALSVIRSTGRPFSAFKTGQTKERPFDIYYHFTEVDRPLLYSRIEHRVDEMMDRGLLAEVESLLDRRHLKALDTVGYSELFDYFDGQYTLPQAVDKIKQHSRNYAKRQLTWFKKYVNELREIGQPLIL